MPGPGLFFNAEQPQLPAQAAVVPAFGLLQELQVLREFCFGGEGGAVNALQHGPALVPPPVRPGDAGELEGLEVAGGGNMGPPAQVHEGPWR